MNVHQPNASLHEPSPLTIGQFRIWPLANPLATHLDHLYLYAHCEDAYFRYDTNCWEVAVDGRISFRTLMNALPLLDLKSIAGEMRLQIEIQAVGEGTFHLIHEQDGSREMLIAIPLDASSTFLTIDVPLIMDWEGFLYVEFAARSLTRLKSVCFNTHSRRAVISLGVAITTFGRAGDVQRVLRSVYDAFCDASVQIKVVNNGPAPLPFEQDFAKVDFVKNPNLGGAGGFTRALLEYRQSNEMTHIMFMDDDALCHPTSVIRTRNILSLAKSPRAAVTGAMMYRHNPALQYETGAMVGAYGVTSINQNIDVGHFSNLFQNEKAERPHYGAWWYFVFPLSSVKTLPFPFFVRGDDITFSLQNRFDIYTLMSAVSWQPSFEHKINTTSEYLATRSFLTMPLIVQGRWQKAQVLDGYRKAVTLEIESYRYPIAEAMLCACQDALADPSFWANEANTLGRLGQLAAIERSFTARSQLKRYQAIPSGARNKRHVRRLERLCRLFPILRRVLFRKPGVTSEMAPSPQKAIFRTGMLYQAPDGKNVIAAKPDWAWRKSLYGRLDRLCAEYSNRFSGQSAALSASHLQTAETWTEKFKDRRR